MYLLFPYLMVRDPGMKDLVLGAGRPHMTALLLYANEPFSQAPAHCSWHNCFQNGDHSSPPSENSMTL